MKKVVLACEQAVEDTLEDLLWVCGAGAVSSVVGPHSGPVLEAYFPTLDQTALLEQIKQQVAPKSIHGIQFQDVDENAWQHQRRESFVGLSVGGFKLAGPEHQGSQDSRVILIEAGNAFGTGEHTTTRLMIERMATLDFKEKSVLDVGCGTGILAIIAERLGAASVLGFDVDPQIQENMARHLQLNQTRKTRLEIGPIQDLELGFYHRVLANVTLNVFEEVGPYLRDHMLPGAEILCCGILETQKAQFQDLLGKHCIETLSSHSEGEWLVAHGRRT